MNEVRAAPSLRQLILCCLAGTVGYGCASDRKLQHPLSIQPPSVLANGSQPKLCIALSGGGIRAGAVALGALQKLHERGILDGAEYLTAVSGGGYPVYGILEQATHDKKTLDDLLGQPSTYVEEVEKNAAFIDTAKIFSGVVTASVDWLLSRIPAVTEATLEDLFSGNIGRKHVVQKSALSTTYGSAIDRTFGHGAGGFGNTRLKTVSIPNGFPYPIMIATVTAGRAAIFDNDVRNQPERIFELSTRWIGSDTTRYWGEYIDHFSLSDAIVSSGAAIDTPEVLDHEKKEVLQDEYIPEWAKKLGISLGVALSLPDNKNVFIADGGFIDNQGVLPLIRRNCAEIIALDATSDTKQAMNGWKHLSTIARPYGWVLELPPSNEISEGAGWRLPGHVFKLTFSPEGRPEIQNRLTVLKLGFSPNDHYDKDGILKFKEANWSSLSWDPVTGCNEKAILGRRCKFPLEATGKQSFTQDEFRAYRLLGMHMVDAYADAVEAQ